MKLRVFPPGTVVCTCSCNMGTTAIVKEPLITNQTFIGLRPLDDRLNSEYLYWALQAVRDDLNAQATGAIQQYLSRDDFRQLRLPIPPAAEQRAIADYLDTETARIDALITKKRRMIELFEERFRATVETALLKTERFRLKHLLDSRPSYGVLVPRFVDSGGVPFIRVNAINSLGEGLHDLPQIDKALDQAYRRTRLTGGEVLVSVVGTMGRSAIVPTEAAGSNIARAVCRLNLRSPGLAQLIQIWISSTDLFLDQALLATGGDTAQPTLNVGDLVEFEVHVPSSDAEVAELAVELTNLRSVKVKATHVLLLQLELLTERRQALITAAVTGELPVPGMAA